MNNEPVAVTVALGGLLTTAVALTAILIPGGLPVATQAAIIAFGNAIILTASILVARSKVTPTANPTLAAGTVINVPTIPTKAVVAPDLAPVVAAPAPTVVVVPDPVVTPV